MLQALTISTRIIPYAFPSKPSEKLFPCAYFHAYSYLPGCHLCNSLAPRTFTSLLQLVRYCLSGHVRFVPQQINSRQYGVFRGHCGNFSWSTCAFLSSFNNNNNINMFINHPGRKLLCNYQFFLIWHRTQLYPVTRMISLLLH